LTAAGSREGGQLRGAHHTFGRRRKGERAPTQRDLHDAFDTGGVRFLVGVSEFKYSRPNVTTLCSSRDQSTDTTFLLIRI
jgi:hypothetical protein